jgi:hypothetical protein
LKVAVKRRKRSETDGVSCKVEVIKRNESGIYRAHFLFRILVKFYMTKF